MVNERATKKKLKKPSEVVRSWMENIDCSSVSVPATPRRRVTDIQPLPIPSRTIIINTKDGYPLYWREILTNIAFAVEEVEKAHGIK